ncbi:MAG TPA: hypothetical protein DDY71_05570 [Spirochaetia bacterium]|nr:hypothetical protein [Spirochaetia bacterium]
MNIEKTSGIYCIENILNNKKYIGQAQNCHKRIKAHIYNLKNNKETCIYLQRAWNKYGIANFIFYIIEKCSIQELNNKEIYYIKELQSHISSHGYNISWGGDAPMRNRKHSEETIKKFKEERRGEKNHNYGKAMSQEQKNKLSEDRIGEKHWSYGKKHKPETIEKMKKNNKKTALGKKWTDEKKKKRSNEYFGKNKLTKKSTKYRGVTFHKMSQKWRARSSKNGKEIYLGLYIIDIDAAKAYDKYIWNEFKNKELLNFPEDIE